MNTEAGFSTGALRTIFGGDITAAGNYFKISAKTDLFVTGLKLHTTNAGTGGEVRIYEKAGDYINSLTTEGDW